MTQLYEVEAGTTLVPNFSENAMAVLFRRYLLPISEEEHNLTGRGMENPVKGGYCETPEEMLRRCSFDNPEFYNLMASLDFLPNSPTLMSANSGNGGTLSACFFFKIDDNMLDAGGIADVGTKAIAVQKHGGGVGFSLSELREKGAYIKTTHGAACGPVEVLRWLNAGALMVTQGGKREGAQMGILRWDHPDIQEFIHVKDVNAAGNEHERQQAENLSTFNISVAATDAFMKAAIENPDSEEAALLREITESAHKSGDPGLFFIDAAERENPTPWIDRLRGTNPCGEVPLLDNEPCNLGSINLTNFVVPARGGGGVQGNGLTIDYPRLCEVAKLATRYLDTVLEHNLFPRDEIDKAALATRKLGLGVMGWADMLQALHVHYDTTLAVDLGREVMRNIQTAAHEASKELAEERGAYPAWELRPRDSFSYLRAKRRNATLTCIAPTGTIAIIAGVSSGIEPHFALGNTRQMGDGTILEEGVVKTDFIPRVANNIHWSWHVKMQAAFQKHTDLAVSKTINMANDATTQDVYDSYVMQWRYGCKGGTIFRDGSRGEDQVLKAHSNGHSAEGVALLENVLSDGSSARGISGADVDLRFHYVPPAEHKPRREKLPKLIDMKRYEFRIGGTHVYFKLGFYPDGRLGELWIDAGAEGSTVAGFADSVAKGWSYLLQYGVPVEEICGRYLNLNFEPNGLTDDPDIPHATSIMDFIARWILKHYVEGEAAQTIVSQAQTGELCSECGSPMMHLEGCSTCSNPACGHSKC